MDFIERMVGVYSVYCGVVGRSVYFEEVGTVNYWGGQQG